VAKSIRISVGAAASGAAARPNARAAGKIMVRRARRVGTGFTLLKSNKMFAL
jgi:hypothetical protein